MFLSILCVRDNINCILWEDSVSCNNCDWLANIAIICSNNFTGDIAVLPLCLLPTWCGRLNRGYCWTFLIRCRFPPVGSWFPLRCNGSQFIRKERFKVGNLYEDEWSNRMWPDLTVRMFRLLVQYKQSWPLFCENFCSYCEHFYHVLLAFSYERISSFLDENVSVIRLLFSKLKISNITRNVLMKFRKNNNSREMA